MLPSQAYIQAILLMSVSEQGLSYRMFYFMKNDHEIMELLFIQVEIWE